MYGVKHAEKCYIDSGFNVQVPVVPDVVVHVVVFNSGHPSPPVPSHSFHPDGLKCVSLKWDLLHYSIQLITDYSLLQ